MKLNEAIKIIDYSADQQCPTKEEQLEAEKAFWKWNTKRQKNKEYAREQYEAMLKEIDVDFGIPYKEKKAAAIKDLCNYVSEQVRKKEK